MREQAVSNRTSAHMMLAWRNLLARTSLVFIAILISRLIILTDQYCNLIDRSFWAFFQFLFSSLAAAYRET